MRGLDANLLHVWAVPTSRRPRRLFSAALPLVFPIALSGCAAIEERGGFPAEAAAADPTGYEGLRFWGGSVSPAMRASIRADYRGIAAAAPSGSREVSTQQADFVALSGGGGDGTFGAGFLKGWTERGDRPSFEVVTGVSTGALASPFALLSTGCDQALAEIYTTYSDADLYTSNGSLGLIGISLNDTAPRRQRVLRYITPEVIDAIAAVGQAGHRQVVETTNLDAQRPASVPTDATSSCASSSHRPRYQPCSLPNTFPSRKATEPSTNSTSTAA